MKIKMCHQLCICVVTLLVFFSLMSATVGQIVKTEEVSLSTLCHKNFLDEAEIQIYLCCTNGDIISNSRKISVENAREITNKLSTMNDDTANSSKESFEQKLTMLKELDLIPKEITAEDIFGASRNEIQKYLPLNIDYDILSKIEFNGFMGIGFGFGLNSFIPVVGLENIAFFAFIGKVTMKKAFGRSTELKGLIIGGFIGFAGVLIRVLTPYVYGPFLYGKGICLFTIWRGRGSLLPF